jgi:topoisomerase-4 subunit A
VAGLASARGYGEPLTGKLGPPDGASFVSVLLGNPDDLYLLATDAGYGFICAFDDMMSRNKAGKLVLTVPDGAMILPPLPVVGVETDRLAAVGGGGRLLVFPVNDLPRLPKGKGNRILDLPGEERLVALTLVPPGRNLILAAGKRDLKLKPADLESYAGERGRRGKPLPRGFQRVERLAGGE